MPLDISKFVEKKKKRNCFHTIKYLWLLYWRTLLDFWRKSRGIIKSILKFCIKTPLILLSVIIILWVSSKLKSYIEDNFIYSIPMPNWIGQFTQNGDSIYIDGIEKIVDEETASLAYCEISCSLNFRTCWEKRLAFSNLGNYSMVFPYEKEYEIKYKDKNKVIFSTDIGTITGEIDLNMKTLFFVHNNAGFVERKPRKIQIITNNEEIKKIEKHIIRKYLRQGIKWW